VAPAHVEQCAPCVGGAVVVYLERVAIMSRYLHRTNEKVFTFLRFDRELIINNFIYSVMFVHKIKNIENGTCQYCLGCADRIPESPKYNWHAAATGAAYAAPVAFFGSF
jgi:hypothetical protein